MDYDNSGGGFDDGGWGDGVAVGPAEGGAHTYERDDYYDHPGMFQSAHGEGGPMNPCVTCMCGIVCLVLSSYILFLNEGQYVYSMQAVTAARDRYVNLCDEGCTRCDVQSVTEAKSGKVRPLKSEDVVYAACGFFGLLGISELDNAPSSGGAVPRELLPLLKAQGPGSPTAAQWSWETDMYQVMYKSATIKSPDLRVSFGGRYAGSPDGVCSAPEFRMQLYQGGTCQPTILKQYWFVNGGTSPAGTSSDGNNGQQQSSGGGAQTARLCPSNSGPLVKQQCITTPGCEWKFPACVSQQEPQACGTMPPPMCIWTDIPLQRKNGGTCTGCCPHEDAWKVSCVQTSAQSRLRRLADADTEVAPGIANAGNASLFAAAGEVATFASKSGLLHVTAEADASYVGTGFAEALPAETQDTRKQIEEAQVLLGRVAGTPGAAIPFESMATNRSAAPRFLAASEPIIQTCQFKFCKLEYSWTKGVAPSASKWPRLPVSAPGNVLASFAPPAVNVPTLSQGHTDGARVMFGAPLNTGASSVPRSANAIALGSLWSKAEIFQKKANADLRNSQPTQPFMQNMRVKTTTYTLNPGTYEGFQKPQPVNLQVMEFDRSAPANVWNAGNSVVGGNLCGKGCICGLADQSTQQLGNLRICFQRSTATSMSVIAGVRRSGGGDADWEFVESDVLQTKKGSLTVGKGFRLSVNQVVVAEDLFQQAEAEAATLRSILRVFMPLIMWIGFYCCLSPIVWIIDQLDTCVEMVPCIGSMLGMVVGCIESLVNIMICAVSCLSALSCSLFIASIAWIYYRPHIGIPMLIVSLLIFGGLFYFASTRKQGASAQQKPFGGPGVELGSSFGTVNPQPGAGGNVPQPQPQPQPAAGGAGAGQFMQVTCPPGVRSGSPVQITAPDGRALTVLVPANISPGEVFMVQI